MVRMLVSFLLLFTLSEISAQLSPKTINRITREINQLRTEGLRCGNTKMAPVHKIYWNEDLYQVSLDYATYMRNHQHFDHISKEGEDAGNRLDKVGYTWRYVGENIAHGQFDFPEVLRDWVKSESHCKMLMSEDMHHFAVAKNERYWVQTFATPMRR